MPHALIAGGGIAGLAVALALARAGWRATVCEQSPVLGEVGAGLQMSPNACRALGALGVLDTVRAKASVPAAAHLRDGRTGRTIYRAALGAEAERRWGAPYLHVHRADLLAVLTEAAAAAGAEVRLGTRVRRALDLPGGAALHFEDETRLEGDLVIGADGIRSSLRAQLNAHEKPRFVQQVAWRGTVPADRLAPGIVPPEATVWAGPGRHLVTYLLRGGSLVNFVAVEEVASSAELGEDWVAPGDPERLREAYRSWHPDVTALLGAVTETFRWGLFDRPEQVTWAKGHVVLVGDAAHAMLPFMAQGAAMALEDAVVLDRCLASGDVPAALARFETRRWDRVRRVQAQAAANGRLFHRRTPLGRLLAHLPIRIVSRVAPGLAAGRLDWLYGYDVTA